MKTFALAIAAVAALAAGLSAADGVKVGDKAPAFTATDDQGRTWNSADVVGKKVLVVYFYPADLTGGCTRQACGYRDSAAALRAKGAEVVGVSGDSVKNHQIFKKEHNLNFTLLADEDGTVANKLGVPFRKGPSKATVKVGGEQVELTRGGTAERWTIVIDKEGKIAHKEKVGNAAGDPQKIAEIVEKLSK